MKKIAVVLGCALFVGCDSNDCVATEVGICQSGSTVDTGPTPQVPGLAAYGLKPSGAHISLDCQPYNVPAYSRHDCLYSHWHAGFDHAERTEPIDCTMKLADRYGLIVGEATKVQFNSEAGAVSPLAMSPAFDPEQPASGQKDLGHAVGFLEVFGAPLPADQIPLPGEQSVQVDFGCGPRTANPRDGLVTVIAYVRGEEGFVDSNRNRAYDPGERFVDLGEPFVDANDNGTRDWAEWYADVNEDWVYTGPNGVWDADTVIWTETRVLYTGTPWFGSNPMAGPFSNYQKTAMDPITGTIADLNVTLTPSMFASYDAFITDAMLNPITPLATYDVSTMTGRATANIERISNYFPGTGNFRLLYCDAPAGNNPTKCLDGPVESACTTTPCYVVPEVGLCRTDNCSGLLYGTDAAIRVLPGSIEKDQPDGVDTVNFTVTIDGIVTWFPPISVTVTQPPTPAL